MSLFVCVNVSMCEKVFMSVCMFVCVFLCVSLFVRLGVSERVFVCV